MRGFLAALQFLTVIPVRAILSPHDFERSPLWFPAVGLLIGAAVAGADLAGARLGLSSVLLSVTSIGLLAALTGGLHLDGLADTADGFLSNRPRERVLEIMRDSRIGTMGTLALVFVLAIKIAALAELTGEQRLRVLVLAPVASRCAQVFVMGLLPYARPTGGLATVFMGRHRKPYAVWSGLWLLATAVLLVGGVCGAVCVLVVLFVGSLMSGWSLWRIGGFTGDTLGATSEVVETTLLFFYAAHLGNVALCGGG